MVFLVFMGEGKKSVPLSTGGRCEEWLKPKPGFVSLPGDSASSGTTEEVVIKLEVCICWKESEMEPVGGSLKYFGEFMAIKALGSVPDVEYHYFLLWISVLCLLNEPVLPALEMDQKSSFFLGDEEVLSMSTLAVDSDLIQPLVGQGTK
ncbi:hypothetical protein AAES_115359 [Amazona aestiva]|uniref:Uncharacterized protein n=1 Tax=Amazona aestiva TaxID=12930 RepID=A0A0Q3M7M6_AMAAE|nr:hypothetical protein AAES_115359 [Amazona aestiva]